MYGPLTSPSTVLDFVQFAWLSLNMLSCSLGLQALGFATEGFVVTTFKVGPLFMIRVCLAFTFLQYMLVFFLFLGSRKLPYRVMGSLSKARVEVITVVAPLVLRYFSPCGNWCFFSLVCLTINICSFWRIAHVAYDISPWDVLLGAVMQLLVYMSYSRSYACLAVLAVCAAVISYRYLSYKAPITPDDVKKDLGPEAC